MTGSRKVHKYGAGILLSMLISLTTGSPAHSQNATAAGCFQQPAQLGEAEISAFMSSPSRLLNDYAGGLPLSTRVRALAGSSMTTVDALLSLAATASNEQKAAIGAGLARASRACVVSMPEYAAQIQQKVAGSDLGDLVTAFIAASDDVQTAALGAPGGPAGAAGIGTGGVAGPGSAGAGGDDGTPTQGGGDFSAGGGGRFFRTVAESVSP
ncbi:hypothetical protein EV286_104401 [Rhizobium sp. BK251]|nr:hypothetical protein EV286_104401 [Rhizobium sp. BK251]